MTRWQLQGFQNFIKIFFVEQTDMKVSKDVMNKVQLKEPSSDIQNETIKSRKTKHNKAGEMEM